MSCDGDGDTTGAGSDIGYRAARIRRLQPGNCAFNKQFGFGARDQNIWRKFKVKAEKFPMTNHIGKRFAGSRRWIKLSSASARCRSRDELS